MRDKPEARKGGEGNRRGGGKEEVGKKLGAGASI